MKEPYVDLSECVVKIAEDAPPVDLTKKKIVIDDLRQIFYTIDNSLRWLRLRREDRVDQGANK